jgi:hypothetical protein
MEINRQSCTTGFLQNEPLHCPQRWTKSREQGGGKVEEKDQQLNEIFRRISEMLENLQYGSITLVVQDGKVIQLEKSEKMRFK